MYDACQAGRNEKKWTRGREFTVLDDPGQGSGARRNIPGHPGDRRPRQAGQGATGSRHLLSRGQLNRGDQLNERCAGGSPDFLLKLARHA